jgi:histidinol dehydrogenase
MGVWHRPVSRAGVYVPGGKAVYPSTVVMTVVPARSPGRRDRPVHATDGDRPDGAPTAGPTARSSPPHGCSGSTASCASVARRRSPRWRTGPASVPRCDVVVGPGNLYVSLAKQVLASEGRIGTDGYAGPTEIGIVADDTADPRGARSGPRRAGRARRARDGDAHHDRPGTMVDAVERALELTRSPARTTVSGSRRRSPGRGPSRSSTTSTTPSRSRRRSPPSTSRSTRATRARSPSASATRARPSSVATTPVSLGDYAAGPNHTLPTSGTARFRGGLTTSSFLVPVNFVEYDDAALAELAGSVRVLAEAEHLPAHWRAVEVRLEGDAVVSVPASSDPGVPAVRDDLRDVVPYGAPQLDVPVRLNTNETPRPAAASFLASSPPAAVARAQPLPGP